MNFEDKKKSCIWACYVTSLNYFNRQLYAVKNGMLIKTFKWFCSFDDRLMLGFLINKYSKVSNTCLVDC